MEPSTGEIEAGCQGTLRVEVRVPGTRAHSARSWLGDNAIHHAGEVLDAARRRTSPRQPVVEGITYHEGLNAVGIRGGVAGNVIPDECVVTVNYRFAPDRSGDEAMAHVREVLRPVRVVSDRPVRGRSTGLDRLLVKDFVAAVGREPRAKYGWTDAARFSSLGVPALNWGPGRPQPRALPRRVPRPAPARRVRSRAAGLAGYRRARASCSALPLGERAWRRPDVICKTLR